MPTDLPTRLAEVYALLDGAPAGDWGFRSVPANPDVPLTIAGGVNSAKAAIAAVNFLRTFRAELEAQSRLQARVASLVEAMEVCYGNPDASEEDSQFARGWDVATKHYLAELKPALGTALRGAEGAK